MTLRNSSPCSWTFLNLYKLRNVHEHGDEFRSVMPQIFQAVGSYGLHEGMRKEVSVSACPECVERMSLMQTKWPQRLSNHGGHREGRKKLVVYRWRWEKRESPDSPRSGAEVCAGSERRAVSLRRPLGNHKRASQESSYLQTCRSGGPGMVSMLARGDLPGS